ncbi:MAG: isoprenylcysteine carboxylmethyltransferase family protein [Rhodospirillaceae bacterium]|jgi:protein-S-isoprenylcysteine O-methyltransferase Ste14|nr:isoprenylcysteine carboxylmethyltransferase family protein [Rhodospirillaceae bacterium]MBT5943228.1 isoprenylcysteine carboxylmethyltransferase family protein [Rhodospirillaceae bacterium]MBT6403966.1 isoprenylcysteine carboxylmethyltransferase family protein [Rhodospirillaceae bacterium]MBT6535373.1 isoprenylcysteine carboxylmethyltransferase family protein [Rhodospirillaceae bacterium]MBT7362813.1 isoprenylcysteine carboxylmethyltransferase family protein [Rhodospirillaceae bacterium]
MNESADREHVPLPPLVYLAGVGLGFGVDWLVPVRMLSREIQLTVGVPIVVLSIVLVLMSAWELWRAGTSPLHERPTTRVISRGLFGMSRNPIYVAMTLGCIGVAITADRVWVLAATAVAVLVIDRMVIRREEVFLTAKFGDEYLAYKARVRRWV